jgi:hypothetical protein
MSNTVAVRVNIVYRQHDLKSSTKGKTVRMNWISMGRESEEEKGLKDFEEGIARHRRPWKPPAWK